MCESMLGCEGVVYMTWWWIPVLEASRHVGCGVYVLPSSHNGRCAKVCWHPWSWPISFFLIFANDYVSNHVLLGGNWLDLDALFVSPLFKPSGWAFCIFTLSCKQRRWQQVSFPTFLGSCHFPENFALFWTITKTITKRSAFLDKMSFADGWPRFEKILEMILCRWILSLAYCDLFASMHILLQRPIALVNPSSSQAQPAGPVWQSLS